MWRADKPDVRDWLYPYYCGAGRGAQSKYKEVSKHWRERVFKRSWLPRLLCVIFVLLIEVAAVLARGNLWPLGVGVILGGLLVGLIALVDSPPVGAERWRTGFEGERRTARVLAPLRRSGYALLHDLPDDRSSDRDYKGNIDHVVVSSAGVFLLDSKWLGGEASIVGDTVHVQMRDDQEDSYDQQWSARSVRGRALRLQRAIAQQTDVARVKAVMVFWNRFDAELVEGENIVFVHGDRLVGWLEEQRSEMSSAWVAHVAACIKEARPSEHRARWNRLPTLGLRGRRGLVASGTAEGAAQES